MREREREGERERERPLVGSKRPGWVQSGRRWPVDVVVRGQRRWVERIWHISQSRPYSGLGFQVKILLFHLRSENDLGGLISGANCPVDVVVRERGRARECVCV